MDVFYMIKQCVTSCKYITLNNGIYNIACHKKLINIFKYGNKHKISIEKYNIYLENYISVVYIYVIIQ